MDTEAAEPNSSAATPLDVLDPGGRLQDIGDVDLRRRVAQQRGRAGAQKQALARGAQGAPGGQQAEVDIGSAEGLVGLATGELRKLLRSKTTADAVKVQAARAIQDLTKGQQLVHDVDLLTWRDVLVQLPVHERLAYLREVSGVGTSPPLAP